MTTQTDLTGEVANYLALSVNLARLSYQLVLTTSSKSTQLTLA